MLRFRFAVPFLLALAVNAHATDVSGTITTQTWTKANSPYQVTGDITIPAGNILTIEPGVDVVLDSAVSFVVGGTLRAIGTPQDSIRFLKSGESYWGGMTFTGTGNLLACVRVSGGDKGGGAGGGICALSGSTDIRNSVISDNKATRGGGVAGWTATLRMTDCTISNNYGVSLGGGVYGSVKLSGCTISGNWGRVGGGIVNEDGRTLEIVNCVVSRNGAWEGGGVWSKVGVIIMSNCTVANNSSGSFGGGFFCEGEWVGIRPMIYKKTQVTLINCTIVGNTGLQGAAFNYLAVITVENCIIWGHASGDYWPTATYSDIQESVSGVGNIISDPLFVDAANEDFRLLHGVAVHRDRLVGQEYGRLAGTSPHRNRHFVRYDVDESEQPVPYSEHGCG